MLKYAINWYETIGRAVGGHKEPKLALTALLILTSGNVSYPQSTGHYSSSETKSTGAREERSRELKRRLEEEHEGNVFDDYPTVIRRPGSGRREDSIPLEEESQRHRLKLRHRGVAQLDTQAERRRLKQDGRG